jgi:hypothetical protein
MIRETAGESALELAAKRLDKALGALEQRMSHGGGRNGDLFAAGQSDSQLQAELDRARSRERELEAAGVEASAALGRAIREIRQALDGRAADHHAEAAEQ